MWPAAPRTGHPGSAEADDCPFYALPAARLVWENELAFAVRDGYPVSEGHARGAVRNRPIGVQAFLSERGMRVILGEIPWFLAASAVAFLSLRKGARLLAQAGPAATNP